MTDEIAQKKHELEELNGHIRNAKSTLHSLGVRKQQLESQIQSLDKYIREERKKLDADRKELARQSNLHNKQNPYNTPPGSAFVDLS